MGDAVLRLGVPARVVGRVRRERPRGDARRRAGRRRPARSVAIVPLMHRHEVEPGDALTHTTMRHGAGLDADAGPADRHRRLLRGLVPRRLRDDPGRPRPTCPPSPPRVADYLAEPAGRRPWDVVDLRRLRCGDPAADALAAAFGAREIAEGWTLNVEREDVCPVVTLPEGVDMEDYLATLGKKERHEIRRKVRRAEAVGEIRLERVDRSAGRPRDVHRPAPEALGRRRPVPADTPGGEQSRVFFRRLFELFGPDGPLRLTFLSVGGRRIAAGIHFETADGYLYYNAGVDPDARDLSPGVLMVYALRRAGPRDRRPPARLPARQRVVQVRVGRGRRADPAPARPTKERLTMSAPLPSDPCLDAGRAPDRSPAAGGSASSRSWRPARTAAPRSTSTRW